MKRFFNNVIWGVLSLLAVATSCSDKLSEIGASTRPSTDGITIKSAKFEVPVQTVYRDSVYVRTGYPLLGNVTDPYMGQFKAGYLAQFYANKETSMDITDNTDSLTFGLLRTSLIRELEAMEPGKWDPNGYYKSRYDSLVGNKIDSMTIRIYYHSYYGDSLAPMKVSIYGLNPDADFESMPESEFYSNNDFSTLYDSKNFLGSKGFTAANREISDSARHTSDFMNYIEVKLDDKYKNQFLRMVAQAAIARDIDNPNHSKFTDIFASESELRKNWLSGVCVKPTFGDGSLIKVYYTAIYLFYSSFHRYAEDGTLLRNAADDGDSTYTVNHVKYIAVTPDVIQMAGFEYNDANKAERLQYADTAFISSPQGYYSTIDLPVGQIIGTMMADPARKDSSYFLNAANFYLMAYKPSGFLLSQKPAPTLLMVQQDSVNTYFEEGMLPNSVTSCYASYSCDSVPNNNFNDPNSGVYYYKFGNISSVIIGLAENQGWGKDKVQTVEEWESQLKANGKLTADQTINDYTVRMALLPVDVTTNSSYGTLLSVSNYILPTCVRLQKGDAKQNIQMIYTLEGTTDSEK